MPQQLPLVPDVPFYRFLTTLDQIQYVFDVRWSSREEAWYMDILSEDLEPLVSGMKIVLGGWLLPHASHQERPFGLFTAVDFTGTGTEATLSNIGSTIGVFFYSLEELEELR